MAEWADDSGTNPESVDDGTIMFPAVTGEDTPTAGDDTTVVIPPVQDNDGDEDDTDGPSDGGARHGRRVKRRGIIIGAIAAIVVIAVAIGVGVYAARDTGDTEADGEDTTRTLDDTASPVLEVGVSADGYDPDDSTPVIIHITDGDGSVDYYHAYDANEPHEVEMDDAGGYEVTFISPVNKDGSIYETPDTVTIGTVDADDTEDDGDDTADLTYGLTLIPADEATEDDLEAIRDAVERAVENGDATLSGDAGEMILDTLDGNIEANPNTGDKKSEDADDTEDSAAAESDRDDGSSASSSGSTSSGSTSNGSSGGGSTGSASSGSSSSVSSGSSSSGHTHDWVAQTRTVHHDAVYKTVHHDAVTATKLLCHHCYQYFDSEDAIVAHQKALVAAGDLDGYKAASWEVVTVTTQSAYDEKVLVTAAYDETVTTGYKCSICGKTK